MVTLGLLVALEAKTGREEELETFLRQALPLVDDEPATLVWFAIRLLAEESQIGRFDVLAAKLPALAAAQQGAAQ